MKEIMTEQIPPLSIQIELTEGCNLGCNFCGLRGMRKDGREPWRFMKEETAKRIADEIVRMGWGSRLIFSMHGEPTLNPFGLNIIRMFRKKLPNSVFSIMSNGYGIVHNLATNEVRTREEIVSVIHKYRRAGMNDLILDYYSKKGDAATVYDIVSKIDEFTFETLSSGVKLYSSNPNKFRILFNPPIQTKGAINRHLCNHCGAAAPLDFSYQGKRCARPFREMTFRYDGSVALCCNDFRGEYPIGNIMKKDIDALWQHKRFKAARILLFAGERSFKPCYGCNALSHRVGLLPDRMGKFTMPKPSSGVLRFAKSISDKNKPLAKFIFKREWEK